MPCTTSLPAQRGCDLPAQGHAARMRQSWDTDSGLRPSMFSPTHRWSWGGGGGGTGSFGEGPGMALNDIKSQ